MAVHCRPIAVVDCNLQLTRCPARSALQLASGLENAFGHQRTANLMQAIAVLKMTYADCRLSAHSRERLPWPGLLLLAGLLFRGGNATSSYSLHTSAGPIIRLRLEGHCGAAGVCCFRT